MPGFVPGVSLAGLFHPNLPTYTPTYSSANLSVVISFPWPHRAYFLTHFLCLPHFNSPRSMTPSVPAYLRGSHIEWLDIYQLARTACNTLCLLSFETRHHLRAAIGRSLAHGSATVRRWPTLEEFACTSWLPRAVKLSAVANVQVLVLQASRARASVRSFRNLLPLDTPSRSFSPSTSLCLWRSTSRPDTTQLRAQTILTLSRCNHGGAR